MAMNKGDYSLIIHTSKEGIVTASSTDVVGFEYTREHEAKWVELLQNMLDENKIKSVFYVLPMNAYWDDKKKLESITKLVKMLSEN